MKVCGVIAEYDPFHLGHLYHLNAARAQTGADYIVVVLGGPFLQRGTPSLFPVRARAEMALRAGADCVFLLPVTFACADAMRFAQGGVGLLNALGVITHLSFGAENADTDVLSRVADMLLHPTPRYTDNLKRALQSGCSYVSAQSAALESTCPVSGEFLSSANNMLGVYYLRAIMALASPMTPVAVERAGSREHFDGKGFPPASEIRRCILHHESVQGMLPGSSGDIVQSCLDSGQFCAPDALDQALMYRLMHMTASDIRQLPNLSEGLENRLLRMIPGMCSREDLLQKVKTKRYPYARLSRLLAHALLQITKDDLEAEPQYAQLLGFRQSAQPLLHEIRLHSTIPIVSKPAAQKDLLKKESSADDLWMLGAHQMRTYFQRSPIII